MSHVSFNILYISMLILRCHHVLCQKKYTLDVVFLIGLAHMYFPGFLKMGNFMCIKIHVSSITVSLCLNLLSQCTKICTARKFLHPQQVTSRMSF